MGLNKWTAPNEDMNLLDMYGSRRKYEVTRYRLPSLSLKWQPFSIILNDAPPFEVIGSAKEVVDIMAEKLGFCYTLVRASDTDWGIELPDGSWTGSLGMLNRGEVDMSASLYTVSQARSQAVAFSYPFTVDQFTFGYTRPVLRSDETGFLKPFSLPVWALQVATLVVVFAATCLIHLGHSKINTSRRGGGEGDDGLTPRRRDHWAGAATSAERSACWVYSAFLGQSVPWVPSGSGVRVVAGLWLLAAYIVTAVYRSNLVATLVLPKLQLPFNSLEELGASSITAWVPKGSRVQQAIETSPPESPMGGLRSNMFVGPSIPEGVAGLYNGTWAYTTTTRTLHYFMDLHFAQVGSCKLYTASNGFFGASSLSYAFPLGSPLKAKVDSVILRLHDSGIIEYLLQGQVRNSSECLKPVGSRLDSVERPLGVSDYIGVFSVFGAGILLSAVALACEVAVFFWGSKSRPPVSQRANSSTPAE
ncbi:glutamate receptor ionotropic, kainate glr-3-like isoform X2 [Eriocheir sinensis]|uniref:glutamate receptor ionotropic, kainate glr-3-like isoform X2 n=1 Tax=Eriocheir sinensis TaxID=95602 RepID=UPI0021C86FA0|nr:glutamate receptor ionotropic, kainate glr-3-like isoform X2 [Eriocheir sinensis]